MKTLSIRQPWAQLICSGFKDIENRTWKTNYRGKILIHAPAKRADNELTEYQLSLVPPGYKCAIIGSVEIIGCVKNYPSIWAEPKQWHWVLANPVLFDKPILGMKGMLGLWEYDLQEDQ